MFDREYEYVSTIAKAGTLSDAAVILRVSQPALSNFLKREEARLGITLFQRANNRMIPTYAGECYMHYVEQILDLQQKMHVSLNNIVNEGHDRIRIGVPAVHRSFVLGAVIPAFKKKFPNVELHISELSTSELEDKLSALELDCILINETAPRINFDQYPIRQEHFVIAAHKDSPLYARGLRREGYTFPVITPDVLIGETFIELGREYRTRTYQDNVLGAAGISYSVSIQARSLDGVFEAVANNLGCAFCPQALLRYNRAYDNVRFLSLDAPDTEYTFSLYTRKGAFLSPSLIEFREMFKQLYLKEAALVEEGRKKNR